MEFFKFENKGVYHFTVIEFIEIMVDGENVEVVKLEDKLRNTILSSNALLVSSCKLIKNLPRRIKVLYSRDVQTEKGWFKALTITSE